MGTKIIQKDISWLTEKVPDFQKFLDRHSYYLHNGGYLAGGFLRKIIKNASVEETLKGMAYSGDIDFFFYNQDSCVKAFEWFKRDGASVYGNASQPNSKTGFAFEGSRGINLEGKKFTHGFKYQFIYKSYGKPEDVLNRFDLANSKIATDGKKVWMVEDWEELEKDKLVRVDNLAGNYLPWRIQKYIGKDYSLHPTNYKEVLAKLLQLVKEQTSYPQTSSIKNLIANKNVVSDDADVLLFYELLGRAFVGTEPQDYENGTLGASEDYAVHVFNERQEGLKKEA